MTRYENALLKCVEEILQRGTAIVSFKYHGVRVNATIGANRCRPTSMIQRVFIHDEINRAVYSSGSCFVLCLTGIDNNAPNLPTVWVMSSIHDFSALRARHFRTDFMNRVLRAIGKIFGKPDFFN